MKKKILFIVSLIYIQNIICQNGNNYLYAEYKIYANTESPRVLNGILEVKKDESYYATFFKQKKSSILSKNDSEVSLQLGSKAQIIYFDFIDSLLIATKNKRSKNYKIIEKLPVLKWNIHNESKKISHYNCNKATVSFRGRKYIAWYSLDIPLKNGPYKFHGLPGLILEIYDETNRFHWLITKIKSPFSSSKLEKIFNDNSKQYEQLNLKKFVEMTENKKPNIETKLPRGISVSVDYKTKRNGIEIKYEWEE